MQREFQKFNGATVQTSNLALQTIGPIRDSTERNTFTLAIDHRQIRIGNWTSQLKYFLLTREMIGLTSGKPIWRSRRPGLKMAGSSIESLRNFSGISTTTPLALLMNIIKQSQMEMLFKINSIGKQSINKTVERPKRCSVGAPEVIHELDSLYPPESTSIIQSPIFNRSEITQIQAK